MHWLVIGIFLGPLIVQRRNSGSLWLSAIQIIKEWRTIRVNGVNPFIKYLLKMAEFLNELGRALLTTEKRVVSGGCCSMAATTINTYHSSEEELKQENKFLKLLSSNWKIKLHF